MSWDRYFALSPSSFPWLTLRFANPSTCIKHWVSDSQGWPPKTGLTVKLNLYHYLSLPFQFRIIPESTMKVTKDTVTFSGLRYFTLTLKGQTVQLKDADPNDLQLFIENLPASIKGKTKSMKCNFQYFCWFWFWNKEAHGWTSICTSCSV